MTTLALSVSDEASLIDDARVVIYDHNLFISKATGANQLTNFRENLLTNSVARPF